MAEEKLSLKILNEKIKVLEEKPVAPTEVPNYDKDFEYVRDRLEILEDLISRVESIKLELDNLKSVSGRAEGVTTGEFFGAEQQQADPIFEHAGEAPVDSSGAPLPKEHKTQQKIPTTVFQVP